MRSIPPQNERDRPPFRTDLVLRAWPALETMVEVLYLLGLVPRGAADTLRICEAVRQRGAAGVHHPSVTLALLVVASGEGKHAADWLESAAIAEETPRQKPPPTVDLLLRLEGVDCRRLLLEEDLDGGIVRCTIWNHRGDVVSHEGGATANALEGAIQLADARRSE